MEKVIKFEGIRNPTNRDLIEAGRMGYVYAGETDDGSVVFIRKGGDIAKKIQRRATMVAEAVKSLNGETLVGQEATVYRFLKGRLVNMRNVENGIHYSYIAKMMKMNANAAKSALCRAKKKGFISAGTKRGYYTIKGSETCSEKLPSS